MLDAIRNVALVSKNGCGKTSFMEALLYNLGKTNRLGRVEDGNTVLDSEPFEIDKKMSIFSSLVNFEWQKKKMNFIDTPGYIDFCGEVYGGAKAADQIALFIDANEGINNQTIANIDFTNELNKPRLVVINKFDKEETDFDKTFNDLKENFGSDYILFPVILPVGTGKDFKGVANILTNKAYIYKDELGNFDETDIPADLQDTVDEYKEAIFEAAAEEIEELMEKYLEEGELTQDEVAKGLKAGISTGKVIPVVCCSAYKNIGVKQILDYIATNGLNPADLGEFKTINVDNQEEKMVKPEASETHAFVFKMVSEAGVGDLTYVRVFSGKLEPNSSIINITTGKKEKIGALCRMVGKKREEVPFLDAGEMGAILKMKNACPGHILTSEGSKYGIEPVAYPHTVISEAVLGKEKKDQERLGEYLVKYSDMDPTFKVLFDSETGQTIISGMGAAHLQLVLSQVKNVEYEMQKPKIHYRESITKTVVKRYRHKKQSGGKGQFGEVEIELKPLKDGKNFEFIDAIVGGVVPSKFIGPTERGIVSATQRGVIAGYPVVNVSCKLQDGKTHDVDSSDMAFQIAGSRCFQLAAAEASPIILEPIMDVSIEIPKECYGDIQGDLMSRRGRPMGMEEKNDKITILNAKVPEAEMYQYANTLRSITGGTGTFSMNFSHYEKVGEKEEKVLIAEYTSAKEEE